MKTGRLSLFALCAFSLPFSAGCGGSGTGTGTGDNPYKGSYTGRCHVASEDVGPGALNVQADGAGVVSLSNQRGRREDYVVFVGKDGAFTGNWFGQGVSTTVEGKVAASGEGVTVTARVEGRVTPFTLRLKKQ